MRDFVNRLGLALTILWSLLAWGAYALTEWLGGLAARHSDQVSSDPRTVENVFEALTLLTKIGLFGVVAMWLLGVAFIWLLTAAARFLARRDAAPPPR